MAPFLQSVKLFMFADASLILMFAMAADQDMQLRSLGTAADWIVLGACGAAGMMGGAITQLLTVDARKPPRSVIVGDILSSVLMGCFIAVGDIALGKGFNLTVLVVGAAFAGTLSSVGVRKVTNKYIEPHLLDEPKQDVVRRSEND